MCLSSIYMIVFICSLSLLSPSFPHIKTTTLQFTVMREGVKSLTLPLPLFLFSLFSLCCCNNIATLELRHPIQSFFFFSSYFSLLSLLVTVRCHKYDRVPKFVTFAMHVFIGERREKAISKIFIFNFLRKSLP